MALPNHLPARSTDPVSSWMAAEHEPDKRRARSRYWVRRALTEAFPDGATDHEIRQWAASHGCTYPVRSNRLATERGVMRDERLIEAVDGVRRPTETGHLAQVWKWVGA